MASSTDPDGTEDVNDFLLRIREMGDKRDKEDEARTKKLEDEILQGRRERQARRAERARSISPTKDSPVLDAARLSMSSFGSRAIDPPEHLEPTTQAPELEPTNKHNPVTVDHESTPTSGLGESKTDDSGMVTSPTRAPPTFARSRTGTLSWQQRPSSRDLSSRSLFSTSPTRANRLRSSTTTNESQAERHQVAERGAESPVLSKNTVENLPDTLDLNSNQETLEMDQESTAEPEKQSSHQVVDERSRSPSRASSTFGDGSVSNRYSSISSVSTTTGLGSPLPLSSAQRFEPRKPEPATEEQLPPSPTQRRLSPERPSSPTKGLGGFVQSAMLKRSDSVSKRWSAQLPSGLTRGNSVASNRNSIAVPNQENTSSTSPPKLARDGPPFPTHRPDSSHSEATVVSRRGSERPSTPPASGDSINTKFEEPVPKPSPSRHSRSASTVDRTDLNTDLNPTSPMVSRTMDPRRWSPTKATWLESALNRPDSPRHKKQPSQQAPWVKDRQSKGSVDLGRPNNFKEVTPVGLMRSVPLGSHYKKPSVAGTPDLPGNPDTKDTKDTNKDLSKDKESSGSEPTTSNPKENAPLTVDTTMEKNEVLPPSSPEKNEAPLSSSPEKNEAPPFSFPEKSPQPKTSSETTRSDQVPNHRPSPLSLTSPPNISPAPLSARDPISPRPKPQSPVVDFRGNLRRREVVKDSGPKEEPEFKNIFGKLKRTETANFVAEDKLKNNILKGKAALNATGGPKMSPKVDEFKETLLKQKEVVKTNGGLARRNTAGENDASTDFVPEAIAKRNKLSKSGSSVKSNLSANAPPSPSPQEPGTPHGWQSQKSPSISPGGGDVETAPDQPAMEEAQSRAADLVSPGTETRPEDTSDGLDDRSKNDEAPEEANQEDSKNEETNNQPVRALPSGNNVATVASAPAAATEGLPAKGKLAGRINPALAGLLNRGPPAPSAGPKKSSISESSGSSSSPAAPLTHVTKGRARGPKRRLPRVVGSQPDSELLSAPKDEPHATQFELPDSQPEAIVSEPELSSSAPKGEPLVVTQPELPAGEPEPPVTQPELESSSAPKDEPLAAQFELPGSQHEAFASQPQPEQVVPKDESAVQFEPYANEPGPTAAEPELSAPKYEPTGERELPVTQSEPTATEPEPSAPKEELTGERELLATQSEPFAPQDETLESQPEPYTNEPEPTGVEHELHAPKDELISERELAVKGPEPPASEAEPFSFKDEPVSPIDRDTSFDATKLDATPPHADHFIGDSNSNWPLPDSQPAVIGQAEADSSPSAGKGSLQDTTGNVTPKSKTRSSVFSRNSLNTYEDVENMGDTPSNKPPVPPKHSPRTPRSEQRWSPRVPYSSQSPSPLRTSHKENSMDSPVGSPLQRTFAGFSIGGRNKSLPSPPVPPKRSDDHLSSPRSSSSLVPLADESMEIISDFFKTFPKTSDRVDIDPQLMLTSESDDLKIRTAKKQIWEITSDGKRQDLPINHEYILYEGSMYLCVHTFECDDGNTRSEAQLWCGDDVPDNAVDDAQTFSRKTAKENGCKLEIIKQGKETARFIHAVGGILITRRGSNSRSSLSALYMLCGRKHLKQMVFDEVDFARRNLCSGFPFVISAPFGKLYLWKGQGSSAEEIGAARLIGMDLGLTGEFEEVTEGEEPESFFEIFNYRDAEDYIRSDYWQLKPDHDRFCCRLLRVDHELGQRSGFWIRRPGSSSPVIRPNDTVQEIEPFCLKDIGAKGIYILDAYFELYVIVGEQASNRPAEFASAVVFAHEYGILAVSLQDRPFIPKSYVSIGGLPTACRGAFRKWDNGTWQMPPQVFPLNAAIDAIRS